MHIHKCPNLEFISLLDLLCINTFLFLFLNSHPNTNLKFEEFKLNKYLIENRNNVFVFMGTPGFFKQRFISQTNRIKEQYKSSIKLIYLMICWPDSLWNYYFS